MIIDDKIKVKTNSANYKHYLNKGYLIIKCGEEIEINTIDLPNQSNVKIRCLCTLCNNITKIGYYNYTRQIRDSYYVCKPCWKHKSPDTVLKKYGVENIMSMPLIINKMQSTNLERYGVKHQLDKKEIRDKVFDYYGVTNISKLDSIKEIKKQKSIKRYGTNTPLQSPEIIQQIREAHIKSGRWKEYDLDKYYDYRAMVDKLTKKNKKQLDMLIGMDMTIMIINTF